MDRVYSSCPVTALAFYHAKDGSVYLLAGEDGVLKVFDVGAQGLRGSMRIFEGQAIHGITASAANERSTNEGFRVALWGGRMVTSLPGGFIEALVSGDGPPPAPAVVEAPDRILDGILPAQNGLPIILVTAHNEVVAAHTPQKAEQLQLGEPVSPGRLLLFSAKAAWTSASALLVVAGTAFGEIVLWQCALSETGCEVPQSSCTVAAVLTGHEGSLFGVDVSSDVALPSGRRSRLLASCSDDRTIRIWDVGRFFGPLGATAPGEGLAVPSAFQNVRETGFQRHADLSLERVMKPVAVAHGHASRIWHVRFAQQRRDESCTRDAARLDVWSFGEDATTWRWQLCLGGGAAEDGLGTSLAHVQTVAPHSGRHIWAAAMLNQYQTDPLVATGGADGAISLQGRRVPHFAAGELSRASGDAIARSEGPSFAKASFRMQDIRCELAKAGVAKSSLAGVAIHQSGFGPGPGHPIDSSRKDTIQRYEFVTSTRLLVATAAGQLLLADVGAADTTWTHIDVPFAIAEDVQGYSVMGSSHDGVVFIGSSSGVVYRYGLGDEIRAIAQLPGKISGIYTLDQPRERNLGGDEPSPGAFTACGATEARSLLVTVLGSQEASLLHIAPGRPYKDAKTVTLDLDEHVMVTSASCCGDYVLVGFRTGWLSVFSKEEDGARKALSQKVTLGKDAVTCIRPLDWAARHIAAQFLTTSRDGMYRIYALAKDDDQIQLSLVHELQAAFGPAIEGAWLVSSGANDQEDAELMLCGFDGRAFKVWNETRRREVASIDCGGGHRSFAYAPLPRRPEGFKLAFTKASTLTLCSQVRADLRAIQEGGHGREIRAVACCNNFVATGAEDTTIRIFQSEIAHRGSLGASRNKLDCLAVLDRHTAGLQCLEWCTSKYLVSSSGNEELFVWRVAPLECRLRGLAVVCEATCPPITPERDVRIIAIAVTRLPDRERMYISMALSDSTLRTYLYRRATGFRLLAKGSYTGACLTQIRILRVTQHGLVVATAATDGHVAVWTADAGGEEALDSVDTLLAYVPRLVTRLHSNSIKALQVVSVAGKPGRWHFVTGGDDNALCVLCVDLGADRHGDGDAVIVGKYRIATAHAAAITGLEILDASRSGLQVVTVGCDQRVKRWKVQHEVGKVVRAMLLEDSYTAVADAGDLGCLYGRQLVVAGVGLEMWDVERMDAQDALYSST